MFYNVFIRYIILAIKKYFTIKLILNFFIFHICVYYKYITIQAFKINLSSLYLLFLETNININ